MGRDVTAILMGDPGARNARLPRGDEIAITNRAHWKSRARKPRGLSELGAKVRAMKPGDALTLDLALYSQAAGQCQYMRNVRGWVMRQRVIGPDHVRVVQIMRLK